MLHITDKVLSVDMTARNNGGPSAPHHKPPPAPGHYPPGGAGASAYFSQMGFGTQDANMSNTRAKTILKEAVDAVVNSFAKHTQGYGRGKLLPVVL